MQTSRATLAQEKDRCDAAQEHFSEAEAQLHTERNAIQESQAKLQQISEAEAEAEGDAGILRAAPKYENQAEGTLHANAGAQSCGKLQTLRRARTTCRGA